jgi:hypothetical protein
MKALKFYLIAALAIVMGTNVFSQSKIDEKIFESLPQSLELKDELQKYVVTTDHFNFDIFGNFFNKQRIRGEYTRGLGNGMVKWNNVSTAMSMQRNTDFPTGSPVSYMDDFTYSPSEDMLNSDKFQSFGENSALCKNLIWDMMGIEGFAWSAWNKLKLNKPYSAKDFNGKMDLAGKGSFENKDVLLTWTGVSEMNGELCALIDYRTFDNPLEYSGEELSMKGRSHYWGTIWVSLEDKQIEHAVLYEDVIMEMLLPGQTTKQILDARREITYVKEI